MLSVWRDSRYVADFSPDPHQADRPPEEPSAPTPGKGGPNPKAATPDGFMEVTRRSKAKPARPLSPKRSGPSSDVESVHRERHPAQDSPPAAAVVWPEPVPPLSEEKLPVLPSPSAACPATLGMPEIKPRSRTLRCKKPS